MPTRRKLSRPHLCVRSRIHNYIIESVRDETRTFSVGITKATHPVTGGEIFSVPDDQIELAEILCRTLVEDKPYEKGDEVALFLNGLGGITFMEMSMLYRDMAEYLAGLGITVFDGYCNNCLTTQEMSGISVSLSLCGWTTKKRPSGSSPAGAGFGASPDDARKICKFPAGAAHYSADTAGNRSRIREELPSGDSTAKR